MEVIASAEHCGIVACKHPTRNIRTVQYHPEATAEVILKAMEYGEMSEEESNEFDLSKSMISLKQSLL
jgi:GMP synthase-like glutamine amidotransferase